MVDGLDTTLSAATVPSFEQRTRRFFINHRPLIALAIALVLLLQIQSWWRPTPDTTAYMSIARSIATGHGPLRYGSPQLQYQPGYAFIITPFFYLSSQPFLLLSIFQVLLAAAALYCLWRWARPYFGNGAIVLVALTAANVGFLNFTRYILTEIPTTLLLLICALTLRRTLSPKWNSWQFIAWAILSTLLLLVSCMTRYVAFCLIPGLLLATVVSLRQRRHGMKRGVILAAVAGIPCFLTIVCWIIFDKSRMLPGERTSLDFLTTSTGGLLARIIETIRLRICVFGRLTIPGLDSTYGSYGEWLNPIMLLYVPLFLLVIWGWWKLLWRTRDILVAAMPFYLGLYLIWQDDAGVRLFVPTLPVIWMCLWRLLATWRPGRYTLAAALIISHLCIALAMEVKYYHQEGTQYQQFWPVFAQLRPQLMPHRETIALRGFQRNDPQWWLAFQIDHHVFRILPGESAPAWISLIIQPAGLDAPDHFVPLTSSGGLDVLQRQPPAAP